jgi:hypothetical protein
MSFSCCIPVSQIYSVLIIIEGGNSLKSNKNEQKLTSCIWQFSTIFLPNELANVVHEENLYWCSVHPQKKLKTGPTWHVTTVIHQNAHYKE